MILQEGTMRWISSSRGEEPEQRRESAGRLEEDRQPPPSSPRRHQQQSFCLTRNVSGSLYYYLVSLLLTLLLLLCTSATTTTAASVSASSTAVVSTSSPAVATTTTLQRKQKQQKRRQRHHNRRSRRLHNDTETDVTTTAAVSIINKANNNNNNAGLNGLKNAAASAMAAACCKALLQPIDAVKTVQQYTVSSTGKLATGGGLSVWQACRELGHVRNFYKGLGVTVLGSMPSVGLYFGVYSYCKQRFLSTETGRNHETGCIAAAAAIGNTVASMSRVPYEVVKQKLQTGQYATFWAVMREVVSSPSAAAALLFPKGGIWTQMIRDVPYAVVTLLLYERLQQRFNSNDKNDSTTSNKNTVRDFVLGGVAGGVGSLATNPMDVIKTRLQTNSELYQGSVVTCVRQVYKEGGVAAFGRGCVPRLMHKVPANAFFFWFYEFFKRLLRVQE